MSADSNGHGCCVSYVICKINTYGMGVLYAPLLSFLDGAN